MMRFLPFIVIWSIITKVQTLYVFVELNFTGNYEIRETATYTHGESTNNITWKFDYDDESITATPSVFPQLPPTSSISSLWPSIPLSTIMGHPALSSRIQINNTTFVSPPSSTAIDIASAQSKVIKVSSEYKIMDSLNICFLILTIIFVIWVSVRKSLKVSINGSRATDQPRNIIIHIETQQNLLVIFLGCPENGGEEPINDNIDLSIWGFYPYCDDFIICCCLYFTRLKLVNLQYENDKLEGQVERLQEQNVQLENTLHKMSQLQNTVYLIQEKINTLSENFDKQIKKERSRYKRKLKIISKEQGNWKEMYNQLKKELELQSKHLKNREVYWKSRCEDLEKQNDDLTNYIAQFPKLLEAVKKKVLLSV